MKFTDRLKTLILAKKVRDSIGMTEAVACFNQASPQVTGKW